MPIAARTAARGAVEHGEETIICGVDLTAAIAVELVADVGVVTPEQFAPGPIASCTAVYVDPHDVGEEQRRGDGSGDARSGPGELCILRRGQLPARQEPLRRLGGRSCES